MDLFKWTLPFFLMVVGASEKVSSETCKTSGEVTEVGQNVTLKFDRSQKTNRLMLTKNGEEFYFWYGQVRDLEYKGYQGEDLERLKWRVTASTLSEDPLTVTWSPVEAGDRAEYCLMDGRTCLECVTLVVQKGSSLDPSEGDAGGNNTKTGMIIGIIIAAVIGLALIIGIVYLGVRCIRTRRAKWNDEVEELGERSSSGSQTTSPTE